MTAAQITTQNILPFCLLLLPLYIYMSPQSLLSTFNSIQLTTIYLPISTSLRPFR